MSKETVIGVGIAYVIWRKFGGILCIMFLTALLLAIFLPEPTQSEILAEQQQELTRLKVKHGRLTQFQDESDEYAKPLPDKPFRRLIAWRSNRLEALELHVSEDYGTKIVMETYSKVTDEISTELYQEKTDMALYHIRDLVAFLKRTSFDFPDKEQEIKRFEYIGNKLERLMQAIEG